MSERQYLYKTIADDIRGRLISGEYAEGALPSENDLAEEFEVSRLTLRKALSHLRDEGLVESRRGSGWYAARGRTLHTLNHLGTIEGQLAERGMVAQRRILDFTFVPAIGRVREVLDVDVVLRVTRISLGDGEPVARVTAWCPEEFGREMTKAAVETQSLYDLLPVEISGAEQVVTAVEATEAEAELLDVPVGSACLMSTRTTFAKDGRAVLFAVALFPGRSTAYVAHLTQPGEMALRLASVTDVGRDPVGSSAGDARIRGAGA